MNMLTDSIPQIMTRLNMMVKGGDRILREDAFTFGPAWMNRGFTNDLSYYLKQYNLVREYLHNQFSDENTMLKRVEKLPEIPFKDFSFKTNLLNLLVSLLAILIFPLGLFHMFRVWRYVKKTKGQIGNASSVFVDISTLIREPEEAHF